MIWDKEISWLKEQEVNGLGVSLMIEMSKTEKVLTAQS